MRFKLILSIVSLMIIICGVSMVIPGIVDHLNHEQEASSHFFVVAAGTVLLGVIGRLLCKTQQEPLRIKEMFLTTTLIWVVFATISALPFYFSTYDLSITDAFFESMSGLTTTGATILSGLDNMSHGLLLWRSLLQWLGGLGIIVVVLMVLPTLHIGGMHFFTIESSEKSDKSAPKMAQTLKGIIYFFLLLSVLCAFCLWLAGMNLFDAINHAMTTVSTGGFSTKDTSIAYYHNSAIEWIITIFMAISGLPMIIGLLILRRKWQNIKNDEQIKTYFWIVIGSIAILSLYRWHHFAFGSEQLGDIIRSSAFNIISIMTTTGYVTENYMLWGNFSIVFFLMLLMTGACTGSTSGGIKMFRYTIFFKTIKTRMKSLVQPHGVFVPRYGDKPINDNMLIGIMVFIGLYFFSAGILTLTLSLFGLDLTTSLSGTLTSLSNVGPAIGQVIGPDKTFALLPDPVKWILSFAMLMGRLEFVAVLMVFTPYMWKRNI